MKKIVLFSLALTFVGSVSFARRLDAPEVSNRMAVVRSGQSFKVFYKAEGASKVTVNIYDDNGVLVLSDNVGKIENFVRPYNFSSLKEGHYTIELIDENGKQTKNVDYATTKITKTAKVMKLENESRYVLMVPAVGQNGFELTIRDENNNIVYQETQKVSGDFAKIYDLKSLSGKFSFEIYDNDGTRKVIQ